MGFQQKEGSKVKQEFGFYCFKEVIKLHSACVTEKMIHTVRILVRLLFSQLEIVQGARKQVLYMALEKLRNMTAGKSGSVSTGYLRSWEGLKWGPGNKVVFVQTISKCQGGVIHTETYAQHFLSAAVVCHEMAFLSLSVKVGLKFTTSLFVESRTMNGQWICSPESRPLKMMSWSRSWTRSFCL